LKSSTAGFSIFPSSSAMAFSRLLFWKRLVLA
jgi:hypothetical protein